MAICYARLEFVKRSVGKNMVLKSAYNAKTSLKFNGNCVLPEAVYTWTVKRGEKPISYEILLPKHVDIAFRNPEMLWNYAESFEKRKDSQVGIEVLLALPDDKIISDDQRIEMAHGFAEKHFISKGYGVQVDIHPPSQRKSYEIDLNEEEEVNEKNIHAHLLVTARSFSDNGKEFNKKKANDITPEVRGSNHFAFGGIGGQHRIRIIKHVKDFSAPVMV